MLPGLGKFSMCLTVKNICVLVDGYLNEGEIVNAKWLQVVLDEMNHWEREIFRSRGNTQRRWKMFEAWCVLHFRQYYFYLTEFNLKHSYYQNRNESLLAFAGWL